MSCCGFLHSFAELTCLMLKGRMILVFASYNEKVGATKDEKK